MRNLHAFSATFALIAATAFTPVLAQSNSGQSTAPKPATAEAKTAAAEDDDKVVCRKLRVTGTRIPQRVCRTKAQWVAVEAAARESANTIKDAGAINTTPTPGG